MRKPPVDHRPWQCTFRLRDEGKGEPKGHCRACLKPITADLRHCTFVAEQMAKLVGL